MATPPETSSRRKARGASREAMKGPAWSLVKRRTLSSDDPPREGAAATTTTTTTTTERRRASTRQHAKHSAAGERFSRTVGKLLGGAATLRPLPQPTDLEILDVRHAGVRLGWTVANAPRRRTDVDVDTSGREAVVELQKLGQRRWAAFHRQPAGSVCQLGRAEACLVGLSPDTTYAARVVFVDRGAPGREGADASTSDGRRGVPSKRVELTTPPPDDGARSGRATPPWAKPPPPPARTTRRVVRHESLDWGGDGRTRGSALGRKTLKKNGKKKKHPEGDRRARATEEGREAGGPGGREGDDEAVVCVVSFAPFDEEGEAERAEEEKAGGASAERAPRDEETEPVSSMPPADIHPRTPPPPKPETPKPETPKPETPKPKPAPPPPPTFLELPREVVLRVLSRGGLSASDLHAVEATCSALTRKRGDASGLLSDVAEGAAEAIVTRITNTFAFQSAELLEPRPGENWKGVMRFIEAREAHRARAHGSVTAGGHRVTVFTTAVAAADPGGVAEPGGVAGKRDATASHEVFACGTDRPDGRFAPLPLPALSRVGVAVVQVSAGYFYAAALTAAGEVFTWGGNDYGELGHGDVEPRPSPSRVDGILGAHRVVSLSAGNFHCGAVTEAGGVFCWGWNEYGSVGVKGASPGRGSMGGAGPSGDVRTDLVTCPVACVTPTSAAADAIGGGGGTAAAFGGDGRSSGGITAVSCGGAHTLALTRGGGVLSWGRGAQGRLGHPFDHGINVFRPTPVAALAHARAVQVSAGFTHSLVLTAEGDVFAFGSDEHGELGVGGTDEKGSVPRGGRPPGAMARPVLGGDGGDGEADEGSGRRAVQVSAGFCTSAAVTACGRAYTWGRNDKGQLGHGHVPGSNPAAVEPARAARRKSNPPGKDVPCARTPRRVRSFRRGRPSDDEGGEHPDERVDVRVYQVEAGVASIVFVSEAGDAFACGSHSADGDGDGWGPVPTRIEALRGRWRGFVRAGRVGVGAP